MRRVLAVAKDGDFTVLFEFSDKLFITVIEGKTQEYVQEVDLDYAISLIKKYQTYGWDVVWAYGLDK